MSIVGRLRGLFTGTEGGRPDPRRSGTGWVPDWPVAVEQPDVAPDPDGGFAPESAESTVVGVLQWASSVLVDGGRGEGSWDYVGLQGWESGDMSEVVPGVGGRDTTPSGLEDATSGELGFGVRLVPNTWAFARQDSRDWWTAPLFVVHRR